jgi:RimJ/RimL family protein N-acetyltransferase
MTTPTIETPRLILRPPCAADFPRWADMETDTATMEHLGGVRDPADTWRGFAMMVGAWTLGTPAMFSVIRKDTLDWVGRIGPWVPEGWPVTEVGWGVHRDCEGKGFAFEAAIYAIDYAFSVLGWDRVDHLIADANVRSQHLAARVGAVAGENKTMPGALSAHQVRAWGQTRQQWEARRHDLFSSLQRA